MRKGAATKITENAVFNLACCSYNKDHFRIGLPHTGTPCHCPSSVEGTESTKVLNPREPTSSIHHTHFHTVTEDLNISRQDFNDASILLDNHNSQQYNISHFLDSTRVQQ